MKIHLLKTEKPQCVTRARIYVQIKKVVNEHSAGTKNKALCEDHVQTEYNGV